ncbi:flavin reductase family protein [Amycolatopsis samaneae]|uniref:Flavin reductase family protein n=1 Tax=Amycolatopsis samaneae TaxID=664691 RepID=A0ABW5GRK3_9PSEU
MTDSLIVPETPPAEPSARFRSLMATFPSGVAVVTAFEPGGRPWGMTCSSMCGVALDPPTLLVCLRRDSPTLGATLLTSTFTVNLLHSGARATAELFASGRADRFSLVRWRRDGDRGGPRLIDDAHAIADCGVTRTVAAGDHVVVFGEVSEVELRVAAPTPLLYGLRRFSSWSPA